MSSNGARTAEIGSTPRRHAKRVAPLDGATIEAEAVARATSAASLLDHVAAFSPAFDDARYARLQQHARDDVAFACEGASTVGRLANAVGAARGVEAHVAARAVTKLRGAFKTHF